MEYGFSCMGYEICAAVGVKMAWPDGEVYTFLGDGSFVMLHSELYTAIQEGIKILRKSLRSRALSRVIPSLT